MSSSGSRNKRLFISDIHLGDARSWTGGGVHPYPYVWTKRNVETLKNFLEDTAKREDVQEVVILGDLFDQWIIPADCKPIISLEDIAENNSGIMEKIISLVKNGIDVAYAPGNHDMPYSLSDLQAKKEVIGRVLPGVKYVCDESTAPPEALIRRGFLAAEHGNRYCICNASDWSENPEMPYLHKSFLPLGYFISRLVAYKQATTDKPQNYFRILSAIIDESLRKSAGDLIPEVDPAKALAGVPTRDAFSRELLTGVASDAVFDWRRPINIEGLEGYPLGVSLDSLADDYSGLWENWENHPPVRYVANNDINTCIAAWNDCGSLSEAVKGEYLSSHRRDTNIVIFGHTHHAEMKKYCVIGAVPLDHIPLPSGGPYDFIYVNSGAWVDSAPYCSYVETEDDPDSNRCFVRLISYAPGDEQVRDQGYVRLNPQ